MSQKRPAHTKLQDEVIGDEWSRSLEWPPKSTRHWFGSPSAALELRWKDCLFKMAGSPPVVGGAAACVALIVDMLVGKSYLPEFSRNALAVTIGLSVLLSATNLMRPKHRT
jgi:hypothetical protein